MSVLKYIPIIKTLVGRNTIKKLERSTNAPMWEKAQPHLLEYNKSIITLSSSALILSFSVVKLGKVAPDKFLLGLSWVLFLFVISIGMLILLISFLYQLAAGNIDRLYNRKEWKDEMLFNPEIAFFWSSRSLMIWLSVIEILIFLTALSVLMLTAFVSV